MEITPELIVAAGGVILGVANILSARRKAIADAGKTHAETLVAEADAAQKLSVVAAGLAGEIQTRIVDKLEGQITSAAGKIDRLEKMVDAQELKLDEQERKLYDQDRQLQHQAAIIAEQDKRLQSQDATIAEQGGIIMQLRQRVTDLENENAALKAENIALRGSGRDRL